jgi:hypothetical protein
MSPDVHCVSQVGLLSIDPAKERFGQHQSKGCGLHVCCKDQRATGLMKRPHGWEGHSH